MNIQPLPAIAFPLMEIDLIKEMKVLKAEKEKIDSRFKEKHKQLCNLLGDREEFRDANDHLLVTYKKGVTRRFDSKSFKDTDKELYQSFVVEHPTRTLLLK